MGKIYEVTLGVKDAALLEKFRHLFRFFYHPFKKVWYASERAVSFARSKGVAGTVSNEMEASEMGVTIIDSFPASLTSPVPEATRNEVIACALASETDGKIPTPVYLGRDVEMSVYPGAFVLDIPGGRRKYAWRFPAFNEDVSNLSVKDRFPHLLSFIEDPDTKFVVSLGGGGVKTFAHNVLLRFIEALGVRNSVDEVWGASFGAIMALWYASGVTVEELDQCGFDLYNKRYSLKLSPSKLQVIKNLLTEHVLPTSLRGTGFSGFMDLARSLYDYILYVKKNRQPKIPFFCIAFNVNEFRSEILTPLYFDVPEYRDSIFTVDPIEAAVASSSVPVLFVPKMIKRNNKEVTYIDGMTTEMLPMISVYKKWQIDRELGLEKRSKLFILAANCATNALYLTPPGKHISELSLMIMYHDAMHNAMVESQRCLIARDPNVLVLEISAPLSEWSTFDIYRIPTFMKMSYVYYINDLLNFEKRAAQALGSVSANR